MKKLNKKWLSILVAALIILSACGGNGDELGDSEANDEPETNNVDKEEEVEEVADEEDEEEIADEDLVEEDDETDVTEEENSSDNEIVLGEPIEIGEYEMSIQSFSLGVDFEGKDALIIEYDWVNNSEESASPFMTFMLKGFQDGVETDDIFMVDGVDLSIGQKEVRPGGSIEGAQDMVGIDDINSMIELELDELISFDSNPYLVEIDLSTLE